jgi:Flp pilus assembly protein TadG
MGAPDWCHGDMPVRVRDRRRDVPRLRVARGRERSRGQSLVEFSLLLPLLMVMLMAIIEFSLAFNATLGVNRASQKAALVASEAGNMAGADCLILQSIDEDVSAPNDNQSIVEVQIQRTTPSGSSIYARNVYSRAGSTTCTFVDGSTVTVPYTASTRAYPEAARCNIAGGCTAMVPARATVDTVGVQISYAYAWRTPLGSLLRMIGTTGPSGPGWTFATRNVFRLEPIL